MPAEPTPNRQTRGSWLSLIPVLGILVIGCVAMLVNFLKPASPTVPAPSSLISFRSTDIMLLRMVTAAPYYGIVVDSEGHARRFPYPIQPGVYTEITLTSAQQQAIQEFRIQWCQQQPQQFRPLQSQEAYYDLGVRCAGYEVKQAKVPLDMIPALFAELMQQLPSGSLPRRNR